MCKLVATAFRSTPPAAQRAAPPSRRGGRGRSICPTLTLAGPGLAEGAGGGVYMAGWPEMAAIQGIWMIFSRTIERGGCAGWNAGAFCGGLPG